MLHAPREVVEMVTHVFPGVDHGLEEEQQKEPILLERRRIRVVRRARRKHLKRLVSRLL
jgi:hypothetical protein